MALLEMNRDSALDPKEVERLLAEIDAKGVAEATVDPAGSGTGT